MRYRGLCGLALCALLLVATFATFAAAQGVGLAELRRIAEQGHVATQFVLGFMYANGDGVPQDDTEAVKWYRKAADTRCLSTAVLKVP